ncbi:hypothetical protein LTR10_006587 [Elasticomyces elasticus]|nr:hypothetical protein LTR10_006587 [Elasticomyces elasticus]KAK4973010.1 hypothetical protein LTR42_006304 [Elasticomyces elasticus]
MPKFADSVSVFHFTNRISSAKIRKYKIATERGMGEGGEGFQRAGSTEPLATPDPQGRTRSTVKSETPGETGSVPPNSASPAPANGESGSAEPPTKRPKLKLTVKPKTESQPPQTGTPGPVVQSIEPGANPNIKPKKQIIYRMRYDENMVLDDESLRIHSPTEDEFSDDDPPPPKKRQPKAQVNRDYGGEFYGNYVVDGADDGPKPARLPNGKAPPKPRKPRQPQQPQQYYALQHVPGGPPIQHGPYPYPPQDPHQIQQMQMQMQQQYQQRMQPPPQNAYVPPPPFPPPKVELIGFEFVGKIRYPVKSLTVQEMIDKLSGLSAALTNFGGVPTAPSSPLGRNGEVRKRKVDPDVDNAAHNLLGAFGGSDSEGSVKRKKAAKAKNNDEPEADPLPSLDYQLGAVGTQDGPLSYGIQFIQNALKSWALQRLQQQHTAHWQQTVYMHQQQHPQGVKRPVGRPKKYADGQEVPTQPTPPPKPQVVRVKAENTPEGVAVHAFQQVLESGCLRVNAELPQELTRALRILYMQIDHLINQGSKNEPHWQPMSYGAQIAANQTRVEKWKIAQAQAHVEMEKQRELSQQQINQQMGMPPGPPPTPGQLQHAQMLELERKRNAQHAGQQPYNSQQHLNPLLLGSQPPGTPTGFAPSVTPMNGGMAQNGTPARRPSTPREAGSVVGTPIGGPVPNTASPVVGNGQQQFARPQGPDPNFRFSLPSDHQAAGIWGAGIFPPNGLNGPNIPNRGSVVNVSPIEGQVQRPVSQPKASSAVAMPSIEATGGQGSTATRPVSSGGDRDVEMTGMKEGSGSHKDQVAVKKEATGTPKPVQTNGFSAINVGGAVQPASPAAAVNGTVAEKMNKGDGVTQDAGMATQPKPSDVVMLGQ